MASSCCSPCSIQSARASSCDEDFFLHRSRLYFIALHLSSDQRIDGASSRAGCRTLCHTGEAPQAVHDIFGTVFHDFARQEWICEKGSCHVNNIGFSGCDDLFHLRRIIQTADRCDRNGTVPGSAQRRGGKSHQPHTLQMPGNLRLRYPDDTHGNRRLPGVPCTR